MNKYLLYDKTRYFYLFYLNLCVIYIYFAKLFIVRLNNVIYYAFFIFCFVTIGFSCITFFLFFLFLFFLYEMNKYLLYDKTRYFYLFYLNLCVIYLYFAKLCIVRLNNVIYDAFSTFCFVTIGVSDITSPSFFTIIVPVCVPF